MSCDQEEKVCWICYSLQVQVSLPFSTPQLLFLFFRKVILKLGKERLLLGVAK